MSNRELINRLRGIYTIPVNDGAGPLDGKDTFTRKFGGLPPIQGEAADEIERLQAENARLREALEAAKKLASDRRHHIRALAQRQLDSFEQASDPEPV